ncbi:FRIGIDA-like protein 4b [Impatiens glandulifera]|uniref:FRIGIDA-like protein 4b n=1 Tax=Impatiens glandulifera TaxID=253017 RepID=UPI001FB05F8D|nr:FRIGIDA-like protein 4b [Impatiens glandulifera]
MSSIPDPGGVFDDKPPISSSPMTSFDDFQRQASLMTSCTLLWKELSDHFSSLEQDLQRKSDAIKRKITNLDNQTKESLDFLEKRETTIDGSLSIAFEKMKAAVTSLNSTTLEEDDDCIVIGGEVDNGEGLLLKLRCFCTRMDSNGFWGFVIVRKKELELMRAQMPSALSLCVDPARFVLEAISKVFPVDKRTEKNDRWNDLGWACVLILESLIPVMVDPFIGNLRMLVTPMMKERAKDIAETWKLSLDERGGIENVKTPDVHTFLQHLVTFGIVKKEDFDLYRKLVMGSAWRKQMPKLAVSLGLTDQMPEMIEELIGKGQQVDAVHFTYEVGLIDKYPPVPLLKAFLKDSKKSANSILEDHNNNSGSRAAVAKKEQSALRAVVKCIEEYKLEDEFPPENLKKRIDQLEKTVKSERKRPATVPANKRTRASSGGPMPPAKAGRSTNAYVSSFPVAPAFIKSPSPIHYPVSPLMYGSRSSPPGALPVTGYGCYSPESYQFAPPPPPPLNYSPYGGGGYMAAIYQQAYYR